MNKYRQHLPQLHGDLFLTDGGLETTLIFHEGIPLPHFAAFDLLKDDAGCSVLRRYFARYAEVAREQETGLILETSTWRASADWGTKLGYDARTLADANRRSVDLLLEIRDTFETDRTRIVISGNLGPRGDGYRPGTQMTVQEAQAYHAAQVRVFAETDVDMIAAFTMNYIEEAIGIVRAAMEARMPVAISFTTETDGKLPSGTRLDEAIRRADEASDGYPVYYMINCMHPTHLAPALSHEGSWRNRVYGLRANASKQSHAELDEATELDGGNSQELAQEYADLRRTFSRLSIVGGCCGTDHRHVDAIGRAMSSVEQ